MSICDKTIYVLYILLFFITPLLICPWTYELFEFPKMIFVYALAVLIVACFTIRSLFTSFPSLQHVFKKVPWITLLFVHLVWFFFSVVFSMHIYTSIFGYYSRFHGGLFSVGAYLALFLVYIFEFGAKPEVFVKFCFALVFSSFIVSIYAVLQHFGIDNQYWVQDSASRVFSFLGQPNWLAAWLLMVIPLSWAFYFAERKGFLKIVFFVLSVITFTAFWFTYSLSGLLGFVVVVGFFFIVFPIQARSFYPKGTVFILALAYGFIITCYSGPYLERIEGAWRHLVGNYEVYASELNIAGGGDTAQIRKIVWRGALDVWKSSPKVFLVGTGPETFAYAFLPHRPSELNKTSEWEFLYNRAHNEYLDVLTEQGAFGLLSYLAYVGVFVWWGLGKDSAIVGLGALGERRIQYLKRAAFCGWLSLLVTNLFGFSVVPTALLFWLYPAFLCAACAY